jgi:hypothetical protein
MMKNQEPSHWAGRLRSSFHLLSHLQGASNITTWANSQFPRLHLHRQDMQPHGLQAEDTNVGFALEGVFHISFDQSTPLELQVIQK